MPRNIVSLLVVIASLALTTPLHAGLYSMSGGHTCTAYNEIDGDSVNFSSATSPFSNAHNLQFTDWSCDSQHSGSFDSSQGIFSMTDELQARDIGAYTFALSSGGFSFRTDMDVLVTYEGEMNYTLPGHWTDASLTLYANRYDFPALDVTTLWSDYDGLVSTQPTSDTAQISGSFILPALTTDSFYALSLGMSLYTSEESSHSDNLMTADGTMQLTLTVVPEPATGLCILIPLAILGRRRRRIFTGY